MKSIDEIMAFLDSLKLNDETSLLSAEYYNRLTAFWAMFRKLDSIQGRSIGQATEAYKVALAMTLKSFDVVEKMTVR